MTISIPASAGTPIFSSSDLADYPFTITVPSGTAFMLAVVGNAASVSPGPLIPTISGWSLVEDSMGPASMVNLAGNRRVTFLESVGLSSGTFHAIFATAQLGCHVQVYGFAAGFEDAQPWRLLNILRANGSWNTATGTFPLVPLADSLTFLASIHSSGAANSPQTPLGGLTEADERSFATPSTDLACYYDLTSPEQSPGIAISGGANGALIGIELIAEAAVIPDPIRVINHGHLRHRPTCAAGGLGARSTGAYHRQTAPSLIPNRPPKTLVMSNNGHLVEGQTTRFNASAVDDDGDSMTYALSVVGWPAGADNTPSVVDADSFDMTWDGDGTWILDLAVTDDPIDHGSGSSPATVHRQFTFQVATAPGGGTTLGPFGLKNIMGYLFQNEESPEYLQALNDDMGRNGTTHATNIDLHRPYLGFIGNNMAEAESIFPAITGVTSTAGVGVDAIFHKTAHGYLNGHEVHLVSGSGTGVGATGASRLRLRATYWVERIDANNYYLNNSYMGRLTIPGYVTGRVQNVGLAAGRFVRHAKYGIRPGAAYAGSANAAEKMGFYQPGLPGNPVMVPIALETTVPSAVYVLTNPDLPFNAVTNPLIPTDATCDQRVAGPNTVDGVVSLLSYCLAMEDGVNDAELTELYSLLPPNACPRARHECELVSAYSSSTLKDDPNAVAALLGATDNLGRGAEEIIRAADRKMSDIRHAAGLIHGLNNNGRGHDAIDIRFHNGDFRHMWEWAHPNLDENGALATGEPGYPFHDVIMRDIYWAEATNTDADQKLDELIAASFRLGIPWGIAEAGIILFYTYKDTAAGQYQKPITVTRDGAGKAVFQKNGNGFQVGQIVALGRLEGQGGSPIVVISTGGLNRQYYVRNVNPTAGTFQLATANSNETIIPASAAGPSTGYVVTGRRRTCAQWKDTANSILDTIEACPASGGGAPKFFIWFTSGAFAKNRVNPYDTRSTTGAGELDARGLAWDPIFVNRLGSGPHP